MGAKEIIIVDDDHNLRRTLCDFITSLGYNIQQAADGNNALNLIQSGSIDLAIVDIFMPDREGVSTIREIKDKHPHVKTIAISGGGDMGHISILQTAKKLGADAVLEKPFPMDKLQSLIGDLLEEVELQNLSCAQ